MKKVFIIPLLLICFLAKAQLSITSGAQMVTSGSVQVVVNDLDYTIQGTLTATGSTFHFTGNDNSSFTGNGSKIIFTDWVVNKSPGKQLLLNAPLYISGNLNFKSGNIELNNQSINLGSTGQLAGESEQSHITGANGGAVHANAVLNAPNAADIGNLGVQITSTQNLGIVYINRYHTSANIAAANGKSVLRKYDVAPAGSSIDGVLTFHYLDAELNGNSESNLTIYTTPDDVTYSVISPSAKDAVQNTITKNGLLSVNGTFTFGSPAGPLPVTFVSFNAHCTGSYILLTWETAAEQNSDRFDIQRSNNGSTWEKIGSVKAKGYSNSIVAYQYDDNTLNSASALYRLAQYDLDGKVNYSEIAKAGCGSTADFKVMPNPVYNVAKVIAGGHTNGKGSLLLYNAIGQLVQQKEITINAGTNQYELNTSALSAGMYTLVFVQAGMPSMSTKIIKQ